jgi:hypothetical protein
MGEMVRLVVLGAIAVLVVAAGCGGSSKDAEIDPYAGVPEGPTRGFIVLGGDNSVPLYGREASPSERRQASTVVQKWMRARAARDFAEECRYFSQIYIKALVTEDAEIVSEGRVKTCPQALAYFGSSASGDFKNTLTGPIDSLRVAQGEGFAQYHGKGGVDYEIPMDKEEGKWWVAKATPLNQEG